MPEPFVNKNIERDRFYSSYVQSYIITIEIYGYTLDRGNKMTAKIKPVEPTVIKDKKIAREVIAQVRRRPAVEDIRWAKRAGNCLND